jgi:hypothetical protein
METLVKKQNALEKLNRLLMSTEWEQQLPRSTLLASTREFLDHTLLILNIGTKS